MSVSKTTERMRRKKDRVSKAGREYERSVFGERGHRPGLYSLGGWVAEEESIFRESKSPWHKAKWASV